VCGMSDYKPRVVIYFVVANKFKKKTVGRCRGAMWRLLQAKSGGVKYAGAGHTQPPQQHAGSGRWHALTL
jgi:hypothetical protein